MPTTGLKRITVPQLDSAMFGQNIRDQFINIDLNFQKLANQELQRGADGTSATYLVYNLDCIFAEATGWDAEYKLSDLEGNSFVKSYCEGCSLSNTQKAAIEEDYDRYLSITGRSKADYVAECWRILFGTDPTTGLSNKVEKGSLVYVLAERAYMQETQQMTLYKNHEAVWLYKWITADNSIKAQEICKIHLQEYGPYRIAMAALTEYDPPKYAGSLAYVFLDPRYYMSGLNEIDDDMMGNYEVSEDMSCVVYASPQVADDKFVHFEAVRVFPQLYAQNGTWYWSLNGQQSGIPAAGPAGKDGGNGLFLIVQRLENGMRLQYADGKAPKNDEYGYKFFEIHPQTAYYRSTVVDGLTQEWQSGFPWGDLTDPTSDKYTFNRERIGAHAVGEADFAWMSHIPASTMSGNYRFRVRKIVGTDTQFFQAKQAVTYIGGEFENDMTPSDHELDGMYTGWKPIEDQNIQDQIAELEGVPCIILPGPEYMRDHHQTTYWFSTIKVISAGQGSTYLEPTVYCGPENMITIYLDENTQAGMMFGLDVYEHLDSNNIGTGQHKPRGMMLPIGSRFIWNNGFMEGTGAVTYKDEFAAHVIYSDLGAWASMSSATTGDFYRQGYPRLPGDSLKHGETVHPNSTDMQGKAVADKRVLHIGSVRDYRALDYVTEDNPGTPGRIAPQNAGDTYDTRAADHFGASELHVDEPMVITRYRDNFPVAANMQARQISKDNPETEQLMPSYSGNWLLLRVEGDVLVGPGNHVNENYKTANDGDATRIGGMIIHGRIDPKTFGLFKVLQHQAVVANNNTIMPMYIGNPDREVGHNLATPFITATKKKGFNYNGDKNDPNEGVYHYGMFVENVLGAQVVHASEGLLVYRFNENDVSLAQRPVFAVDAEGNMLLNGNEVRSTSKNTEWMFHTVWDNPDDNDQQPRANIVAFTTDHETQYQGSAWPKQIIGGLFDGYPAPATVIRTALGYQNIGNGGTKHYTLREHIQSKNEFVFPPVPALLDMYAALTIMHGGLLVRDYSPFTVYQNGTHDWRYSGSFLRGLYVGGVAQTMPDSNATFDGKNKKIEDTIWNRINALTMPEGGSDSLGILDGNMSGKTETENRWDYLGFYDSYNYTKSNSPYAKNLKTKTPITVHEAIMTKTGVADNSNNTNNRTDLGFYVNTGSEFAGKVIMDSQLGVKGDIRSAANIISDGHLISRSNAFVMGQLEADQFRRHTNGNTVGSILLGNGWSTWPSPTWESRLYKGTEFNDELKNDVDLKYPSNDEKRQFSGIILDIGKFYGEQRLIKFGMCRSVEPYENSRGEWHLRFDRKYQDNEITLFGKWPDLDNAGGYKSTAECGYLFSKEPTPPKSKKCNAFSVSYAQIQTVAVISINVLLDAKFTSRDSNKRGWFGGRRRSTAYGFALGNGNHDGNDDDRNSIEVECSGWNWNNIVGESFPKPAMDVDFWAGSAYAGRDDANWNRKGTDAARDIQFGVLFRLTTDGRLTCPIWQAPGAITPEAGKSMTLTFTYPVAQQKMYTWYRICRGIYVRDKDENIIGYEPSGNVLIQGTQTDCDNYIANNSGRLLTADYPYILMSTYTGTADNVDKVVDGSWSDWYIYRQIDSTVITYWSSKGQETYTDENGNSDIQPSSDMAQIGGIGCTLPVNDQFNEEDWQNSDTPDKYCESKIGKKTDNLIWKKTTDTINPKAEYWEILWQRPGSGTGENKPIQILLAGILRRTDYDPSNCEWKGTDGNNYSDWTTADLYGPAKDSICRIEVGNAAGWLRKDHDITNRIVIGWSDDKYVPVCGHATQSANTKIKRTDIKLSGKTKDDGGHWFNVTPFTGKPDFEGTNMKCGIYVQEIHTFESPDNSTWHADNIQCILAINITVFGYIQ